MRDWTGHRQSAKTDREQQVNTDFRTAKTKLAYARKLIAELAATESATEAEQLGQHIALLIGEAAQSKAEGLRRVERFARNFTELMPELIGEKTSA
jgi:hypothetical protein